MINVKTLKLKKKQDEHKRNKEELKRNSSLGGTSVRTKWKNGGSWEYRQGKTKKQVKDSEMNAFIGFVGLFLTLLGIIIFGLFNG